MAQPQEISTSNHSFQTKWILDKNQILQYFLTEAKSIEGMPDVKWSLQWSYASFSKRCYLDIIIRSEFEIEYTIIVRQQENKNQAIYRSQISTGEKKIQLDFHYSKDIMEKYLSNDKLEIVLHGNFSYTQKFTSSKLNIDNAAKWGLRLKEKVVENFDVIVDGKTIKIHKPFLAAESPVFTKMFENNFNEAKENKVTIPDFKHKIVQAAISYCYGQNVDHFMKNENDEIDLLYFCDKYDFQTLKPKLESHLCKKVSIENLSFYVSIVDQANALQLRQACIDLICGMIDKKESHPGIDFKNFDNNLTADILNQLMNRNCKVTNAS